MNFKKENTKTPSVMEDMTTTLNQRITALDRQRGSKSKIMVSNSIKFDDDRKFMLVHFTRYVMRALSLEQDYKLFLVDDRHKYGIKTTADIIQGSNEIWVYAKKRAFVDLLRSIAHELTHAKQHEIGKDFEHDFTHFDNELEDEANKYAGEMVNAYTEVMGHDRIYENI